MKYKTLVVLVACVAVGGYWLYGQSYKPVVHNSELTLASLNYCAGEKTKTVIVSVAKRHLWACEGNKQQYISPVITGYVGNAVNLTPIGTYEIYAKQTDRDLKGSDNKGSWNEHVDYWMPFLYNQYGAYGFHDAEWRQQDDFGKISSNSVNASHGCVELPDKASTWLYKWSEIGTVVKIVN
ncbi:MAG: hypothetical protein JWN82_224 [Candidatus Saccharibacteria bacterium]|nr:hypothetical protein [Candidatus Saccharibacteria bacterium]